jgi:anti-anti-sigma factor
MSSTRASVSGQCTDGVLTVDILVDQIRDPDQSYAVRDQVIALVDQWSPSHMVLDFSQVRFMGSVGMLALLGIRRSLPGGRIVVCNLSDVLRQMLTMCRLISNEALSASPFEVASTKEAAQEQARREG